MKIFSIVQRLRNKIKVDKSSLLEISTSAKIVKCRIEIKGKNNKLIIEDGVSMRDTQIEILGENSIIEIGKNCIVGHGCYLSAKEGKVLRIGAESMLSRNAKIMTSDGHDIYIDEKLINKGKDITIGKHVWLADNVTVLKGVEVGDGSVIGINSTVTKNIPPYCIAVGNPAKVVKEGISWKE
ncbi:acyltransferase [Sulfurimonas sp.]